ncbi:hypothetical protein LUZ63_007864 [Rhynchospora breviuscula]|uniref:MLO-like protein 1 n=1 Tax=Rhynchospora breviuscula TaxID=2022672 RepID=A0A9Q0CTC7_9POAL|nr:hypothetical protein LUZ63_007864 [Rhynchospora breviuscula]
MAGGGAANEITLEYTPTWIVAAVCSVIVLISLFFDKLLHYLGKALKKYNQTPLLEALQKVKEELMLLGFISFLLAVFQDTLQKMCVGESLMHHWLPCKKDSYVASTTKHYTMNFFPGDFGRARRHLLAGGGAGGDYCFVKGKVPIISLNAIHQLHIFIFVLAITHVFLSAITIVLGVVQVMQESSLRIIHKI